MNRAERIAGIPRVLAAVLVATLGGLAPAQASRENRIDAGALAHTALRAPSQVIPLRGETPKALPPGASLAAAAMPSEADLRRYAAIIRTASRANGVEGALVQALIWAESSYNPKAVSATGASGLMQLMPETAARYGVRDVFNPMENIHAGVKNLRDLLALFNGDVELALAAYNAGPYAVVRAGNRIPALPETAAFVPRVIDYYRRFKAREG